MKQVLEKLNGLKILQKSIDFLEDLPEDIYKKYFLNDLDNNLEVDKHRWYETSISIFDIGIGYLGVRSVTDVNSENSEVEDMHYTLEFFEMEQITKISYIEKR